MSLGLKDVPFESLVRFLPPEDCARLATIDKTARKLVGETRVGRFVRKTFGRNRDEIFHAAALNNDPFILDWLKETRPDKILSATVYATAARYRRSKTLEWLHANACPCDERACEEAARKGNVDVLEWVVERGAPCGPSAFEAAADGGSLEALRWLKRMGYRCDESCSRKAAERGRVEVMRWIIDEKAPWDGETLFEAARNGHEDVLRMAKDAGCPAGASLSLGVFEAVAFADLRALRLLFKYDCLQAHERDVCRLAAKHDMEEILWWAHSEEFEWDSWTCAHAAENGNLDLLKWLRERDCPWDSKVLKTKHRSVLAWLNENFV